MKTIIKRHILSAAVATLLMAPSAWAEVAVVVSAKSPVGNMTQEQVSQHQSPRHRWDQFSRVVRKPCQLIRLKARLHETSFIPRQRANLLHR